jgi:hypothetical protein
MIGELVGNYGEKRRQEIMKVYSGLWISGYDSSYFY